MSEAEKPHKTLGGYEVLAELDAGGMGEVLIARKHAVGGFERVVALKTVRGELAGVGAAREMFLDEGRLLAKLHHRGIASVYDFGEDGDRLYLAMEYVAGIDFDDLAERTPPPRIACLAMAEAARALHAAHELTDRDGAALGVVHRDVSPGNLMLTFDGSIKVLDFGIALMRNRRAPVTEFGMLKGKPPYMAPEQVRSESIDARTDVFSASAVLWELLTSERLFQGDSIFAIGRSIEQGAVQPPSTHNPNVTAELDAVVLRGLEKDRGDRFQSAAEFAESLESVARGLGTQTLAEYAAAELADDKAEHEAKLSAMISAAEGTKQRVGRRTSVQTVPAIALAETEQNMLRGASGTGSENEKPKRWPIVFLLLGLFGAAMLGTWILMATGESESPTESSDAALVISYQDAQGLDAAFDTYPDTSPGVDAQADASRPIDARRSPRPSRRDAGRRKPVRKPDAAPSSKKPNPRDAAATAPQGTGTITILHPKGALYANVRIDGRSAGPTPVSKRKLSAGPHVITWVDPESGKVRATRTVVIVRGGHKTVRE